MLKIEHLLCSYPKGSYRGASCRVSCFPAIHVSGSHRRYSRSQVKHISTVCSRILLIGSPSTNHATGVQSGYTAGKDECLSQRCTRDILRCHERNRIHFRTTPSVSTAPNDEIKGKYIHLLRMKNTAMKMRLSGMRLYWSHIQQS